MHAPVGLWEDLECCLDSNAEVVPGTPNRPEQVRMTIRGSCDDTSIGKNKLA